jgi:chemotaxis protein MotB
VKELQAKSTRLSKSLTARELELARQHAEVAKLRGTYQGLVSDLEEEVASGQIEIRQLREGLLLNVSDDILFDSGSATVQAGGRKVLLKVANRLGKLEHQIQVEGHTDNLAIHGGLANRYPTNWELAGARAASVVRLFREAGIAGERLSAISYAEFQPVAANDSPDERARNRRIEIRLEPRSPDRAQSPSPGVADSADSADAAAPQESSAADPPAPTAQPGS